MPPKQSGSKGPKDTKKVEEEQQPQAARVVTHATTASSVAKPGISWKNVLTANTAATAAPTKQQAAKAEPLPELPSSAPPKESPRAAAQPQPVEVAPVTPPEVQAPVEEPAAVQEEPAAPPAEEPTFQWQPKETSPPRNEYSVFSATQFHVPSPTATAHIAPPTPPPPRVVFPSGTPMSHTPVTFRAPNANETIQNIAKVLELRRVQLDNEAQKLTADRANLEREKAAYERQRQELAAQHARLNQERDALSRERAAFHAQQHVPAATHVPHGATHNAHDTPQSGHQFGHQPHKMDSWANMDDDSPTNFGAVAETQYFNQYPPPQQAAYQQRGNYTQMQQQQQPPPQQRLPRQFAPRAAYPRQPNHGMAAPMRGGMHGMQHQGFAPSGYDASHQAAHGYNQPPTAYNHHFAQSGHQW